MPKGSAFEVKAVRREFGPANECIYCHRTAPDVELTEEHIIPEGLRGRMVLLAASCGDCARETHAFEARRSAVPCVAQNSCVAHAAVHIIRLSSAFLAQTVTLHLISGKAE